MAEATHVTDTSEADIAFIYEPVRCQGYDEDIAHGPRFLEVANMSDVQQVKTPVGESDGLPGFAVGGDCIEQLGMRDHSTHSILSPRGR